MSLPSDGVNANALAETTTIPTGKKLIFLDPDTNEGGIITLENLTKQILSNLTSQTFNLDQGTKTLPAALNELNSKAIVTTINTKAENFKESFEMWFSAQKDRSMHIIFLNAGWQCMVVGYRASSKYGRFIQIKYGTDSIEFCSIYEGKFNWQTT